MHRTSFVASVSYVAALAAAGAVAGVAGWAAADDSPPAGTVILNQAAITYRDALGVEQVSTTNEVALLVQRVYAATLTADRSLTLPPTGEAVFHHELRNTGNGSDLFCVRLADDAAGGHAATFLNAQVIHDRDEDGAYTAADTVLSTVGGADGLISLEQDERVSLLVVGDAPAALVDGDTLGFVLTAEPQEETGACVAGSALVNTDVATITDDAVLRVVKTSEYVANGAGAADDQIRYVVTVENIGVNPAADVTVSDPLPTGTTINTVVSHTGFDATPTETGGVVSGTITTLASGATATMTFDVDLDDADGGGDPIPSGTEYLNVAAAEGNLDGAPGDEPAVESNQTVDVLAYDRAVDLTDTATGGDDAQNDGGDDDGADDDVQTIRNIPEGDAGVFDLVITNTGLATDLYELQASAITALTLSGDAEDFPAGSTFRFTRSDGFTPLLDSDGDGWVEIGPLAASDTAVIKVIVDAPFNAADAPYEAEITVRADAEETVSDTAKVRLESFTAAILDLAGDSDPGFADDGTVNADPAATVDAATLTVFPGEIASAPLLLANEGGATESYLMSAGADMALATPLPEGWTATFGYGGAESVSAVGPVAEGNTTPLTLALSPPAGTAPGTYTFYVQAASQLSGARDVVRVVVTVPESRGLTLSPDHSGATAPCSVRVYEHRLTNAGDAAETISVSIADQTAFTAQIAVPTAAAAGEASAFTPAIDLAPGATVAFYDTSADAWTTAALVGGVGGAPFAIALDPGDYTQIRATVAAPCDAAEGQRDVLTLVATSASGETAQAQDVTVVSNAQLTLEKAGAVDATCAVSLTDPGLTFQTGGLSAAPGECLIWRVTAVNMGVDPLCQVLIQDTAPVFTRMRPGAVIAAEPAPGTGGCVQTGADVSCSVGNSIDITGDGAPESYCLRGGETAQIRFSVSVD